MKYFLIISLNFLFFASMAQTGQADSTYLSNAEKHGTAMAQLLLAKNYKAFAKYTYAPIIEMAGGDEKIAALIKKDFDQLETDGYYLLNCTIEKPLNIIRTNNELQCTLTEHIEMKVPNGRIISSSTIIGISNENGENWTFIDTHGKDLKNLQTMLSNLSNQLDIPEKKNPLFYAD